MKLANQSTILKEIKKDISNFRKQKYQRILFSKKKIFLRDRAIKYLFNLDRAIDNHINECNSCLFYSKNLKKKNFVSFYQKFNAHIVLKANYDPLTLIKKTNKNACLNSYFLFSEFLIKNKEINNIQKLNTLLKINDLFILRFKKNKHTNLIKFFKKNIYHERRLLNLYI
tara:strand:+ start:157 stop:666 length:510 start_codon:yes stop_codon:yes gene_type:complete